MFNRIKKIVKVTKKSEIEVKPKIEAIPEPTSEILIKAIEKEKLTRVIVGCNGKIKNMMLRGWWMIEKEKIGEKEYPAEIFGRIQKSELIVMECKRG